VDGVWGENTKNKMTESDKEILKGCAKEYKDMLDKLLDLFGL
jgi:hypothetical protein